MTVTFTKDDLEQFIGTEGYHYNPLFPKVVYTDGVQFIGANGAGWLVDMVSSHIQCYKGNLEEKAGVMFFTTFKLDGKGGGRMEARQDSNRPVIFSQDVEYTDLPFDIDIWAQRSVVNARGVWVLMLKSEY